MQKKEYKGTIKKLKANKIYLNINHLEKGKYNLKIIHKNKIIKDTYFTKE